MSGVRLYRDRLAIRIGGTALGVGFLLIGAYALLGGGESMSDIERERAVAFGFTAVIGGIAAIVGSWAERRLHDIWCAHPRRWRRSRPRGRDAGHSS